MHTDGNQYLKYAFTDAALKAILFYLQIRVFAQRIEHRATSTIARTIVAKELARIVYYVLTREHEFETFKGIRINKCRGWPRLVSPCLTGSTLRSIPGSDWDTCARADDTSES